MRIILTLLRKDISLLRRDRAGLSLTFIVPFALICLFGQIFGVNRPDRGPAGIPFAVVNQSDNPAAARLLDALQAESTFKVLTKFVNPDQTTRPLTEADLRPMMRNNDFRFALVIPADLVRRDGIGLHLKVLSNPRNEIETQLVNGILQRTIFTHVPQLLGQALQARAAAILGETGLRQFNGSLAAAIAHGFGGDPAAIRRSIEQGRIDVAQPAPDATGTAAGPAQTSPDLLSRLVKIESEQVVGQDVKAPAATHIVGGWAMQFLLFALSASAVGLFHEKEHGLFQRILSTPARRAHVLWSKFLYGVGLGLVQLVVLFVAGRMLYGIDVEHHLGGLMLVCGFAAAACTAFGMLLAAVSPSPEAARGLATLSILLMSAIGGAWFPVSFMPEFIQKFSRLTPVYWAMEGFDQVLWANAPFAALLPTLGILGGIAAGVMAVAVWQFNRGKIFN